MDTRNIIANGNNYNVFADQFFERQSSYAVLSITAAVQSVPSGSNALIDWTSTSSKVLYGITQTDSNTGFRIATKGIYLVDLIVPVNAALVAGAQAVCRMVIGGTTVASSNIVYSSASSGSNCLLCLKAFLAVNDTPQFFNFVVDNSVNSGALPAEFRNASLSINKIGSIQTY
jgi:hypothetical protein